MLCFAFITIFWLTGCSNEEATKKNQPVIYASIYPIQYIVEQIGGDAVHAKTIYPPGVDAHTYEPTAKEMTSIAKGDIFFYLGKKLEGFAESTAEALKGQPVKLVELGKHEELFHTEGEHHEHHDDGHGHGDVDPHIWLDPTRMTDMAAIIKSELINMYPEKKNLFTSNYKHLVKDLDRLDQQYKQVLSKKKNKHILVSHAAFGYWEERYGIEQVSINGLSSTDEPSQKDLVRIVKQAKKHHMHAVIFEQNTSNKIAEIIKDHIDAEALTIHNLAVLTDFDILNNNNYISLMKQNLSVLDKALD